jgi:hypothetical protein
MSIESQLDREERDIEAAHERGDISDKEYYKEIESLHADHRAQAEEAAQAAYDNEMGRW